MCRQLSRFEDDGGLVVVIAQFCVARRGEGDDTCLSRRQPLRRSACGFRRSAGYRDVGLQAPAFAGVERLDDVDCLSSHGSPQPTWDRRAALGAADGSIAETQRSSITNLCHNRRVVSQIDCGGPLCRSGSGTITLPSLPGPASRRRRVAAAIDWRRPIPPYERQRAVAIAG